MDQINILIKNINVSNELSTYEQDGYISELLSIIYKKELNPAFKNKILTMLKEVLFNKGLISYEYIEKKYIKIFNDECIIESELDDYNNICLCKIITREGYIAFSGNYLEEYKKDDEKEYKTFFEYNDIGEEIRSIEYKLDEGTIKVEESIRKHQ